MRFMNGMDIGSHGFTSLQMARQVLLGCILRDPFHVTILMPIYRRPLLEHLKRRLPPRLHFLCCYDSQDAAVPVDFRRLFAK